MLIKFCTCIIVWFVTLICYCIFLSKISSGGYHIEGAGLTCYPAMHMCTILGKIHVAWQLVDEWLILPSPLELCPLGSVQYKPYGTD